MIIICLLCNSAWTTVIDAFQYYCLWVCLYIEKMCSAKTFVIPVNNKGITRSSDWKLKKCVIFNLDIKMEFLAVRLIKNWTNLPREVVDSAIFAIFWKWD